MAPGSLHKRRVRRSTNSAAPTATPPTMGSPSVGYRKLGSSALTAFRESRYVLAAILVFVVIFLLSVAWTVVSKEPESEHQSPPQFYSYEVVNEYPHDPAAFTQGLLYGGNNMLIESTGLYGKSTVRKVVLQTGKVQVSHKMDNSFFGEGLTLIGERLFQVTWLTRNGFIYDRHNLSKLGSFTHGMKDGWGLATDGTVLFGTDGTSSLYQINPQNFKVTKSVTVRYKDRQIPNLNELEYINGEIWANVWQSDCIARISPKEGRVLSWILLHPLRQQLLQSGYNGIDVLNGIAWDEDNKRIFVTGKLWPKLYEIKLHPVVTPSKGNMEDICWP